MGKRIIIFHGKSDLNAKRRIKRIIEEEIPESEREMAVSEFRIHEASDEMRGDVIEAMVSLPLGCSRQLIVVWHYHNLFTPVKLLEVIPLIPANTRVVFVSDSILKDREKKKFSTLPEVEVINEYFVKWDGVRHHLEHFFRKQKLKVDREAINGLVKMFSNSPALMDRELEKVSVYFDSDQRVTKDALEGILFFDQNEQVVYEVVNQFFQKKKSETLRKFRQYLNNQGDLAILISVMISELILIVKFKEMKMRGIPLTDIFRELGVIYDKPKKSLQARDILLHYTEVVRILEECFRIDKGIRRDSFSNLNVAGHRIPLKAKLQFERLLVVMV